MDTDAAAVAYTNVASAAAVVIFWAAEVAARATAVALRATGSTEANTRENSVCILYALLVYQAS